MKKRIIRIPLKKVGLSNYIPAVLPQRATASSSSNQLADFSISFALQQASLPGWTSSQSGYPRASLQFNVPDSDLPRVTGWFTGHYDNVTVPASDPLIRNLSNAVETLLNDYFAAANNANLFTSPFRIGWAFRHKDGSRTMTQPLTLLETNTHSPLLSIESYTFLTGAVQSVNDIINHPCRLTFQPDSIPSDWGDITHIDIIAAPQASLLPKDLRATGAYIISEDGRQYHSYRYNRLDENAVLGSASIQNDLRVIASIPVAGLSAAVQEVPVIEGALANWKLLTKYTASCSGTDPEEPEDPSDSAEVWEPYIDKITAPLDLGDPELRKWLWRVVLRGCFQRSDLRIRVYASRHRQSWHLIADGERGWLSALTHLGYRWFRVRITGSLRRRDFLDALTFHITRSRY